MLEGRGVYIGLSDRKNISSLASVCDSEWLDAVLVSVNRSTNRSERTSERTSERASERANERKEDDFCRRATNL